MKLNPQLIPLTRHFPFAQRSTTLANRSEGGKSAQREH